MSVSSRERHSRGRRSCWSLLTKALVPASFIRMEGAGHGFEGAAPADLERAYASLRYAVVNLDHAR